MEKELIPLLRFPEFNLEWVKTNLGSVAEFSKGKGIAKNDIVENGDLDCIRYGELYTEYGEVITDVKSKTNLKAEDLVFSEENDVIIPASGETQIDIATASCILKSGVALGGDLNIIKSPIDGIFLAYYLNNSKKKDIAKLAQGISIVHLYSSQLKTLSINLPEKEEQQKISSFLNSIDGYISLLENKKILIERYKQGVMRKIFSQEIRFKQNNGHKFISWEKKFLNDLFSFHRGSSLSKNDIVESGKNKCIHYGELFTSYSERISKIHSLTNANGTLSRFGDILMPSSDVTPLGLATASVILENGVIIGGDINILRPKIKIDSLYVSYFLNFHKKQILKIVSGTTVKHIYNKDLGKLLISIPQIEEQQKISSFLSNIDYRIECHSEELIELKNFKRGLLQQMFI